MKNNVLFLFFILITLACVALGGVASIHLVLKSILYMGGMGALLVVGLMYTIGQFEEEAH